MNAKSVFEKIWFGNVDKSFFSSHNKLIGKINALTIKCLSILSFIFCSVLALVYLIPKNYDCALFYVVSAVAYGVNAVLTFTLLAKRGKALHALFWFFELLSFINFMFVSVYQQPNNTSTVFFAIEIILPMVYIAKPWQSMLENLIIYIGFIICDFIWKDPSVIGQDMIYAVLFFAITNIVIIYIRNLNITSLEASILFKKESQVDKLTNLYNKSAIESYAKEALSTNKDVIGLVIVDVDDFKLVNDRWGYNQGDLFLSKLSSVLYRSFEHIGLIGRIDGDKFMILLENIFDKDLFEKRIHLALDNISKVFLDYSIERITCSCGIAYKEKNEIITFEVLYDNAEKALTSAKNKGKNRAVIYSKKLFSNGKKNFVLISDNDNVLKRINITCDEFANIYNVENLDRFEDLELDHDLIDVILIDTNNINLDDILNIRNRFTLLNDNAKILAFDNLGKEKNVYLSKGFNKFVDINVDNDELKSTLNEILRG